MPFLPLVAAEESSSQICKALRLQANALHTTKRTRLQGLACCAWCHHLIATNNARARWAEYSTNPHIKNCWLASKQRSETSALPFCTGMRERDRHGCADDEQRGSADLGYQRGSLCTPSSVTCIMIAQPCACYPCHWRSLHMAAGNARRLRAVDSHKYPRALVQLLFHYAASYAVFGGS